MNGAPESLPTPEGYLADVLRYLHLEYGEREKDPDALKLSDLEYFGLFAIEGIPTHYWTYPGSDGVHYATCGLYENTYSLSMTGDAPPAEHRITAPEQCPRLTRFEYADSEEHRVRHGGLFGWFRGWYVVIRSIWAGIRHVKKSRAQAEDISHLPIAELFPRWLAASRLEAHDSYAAQRPGASEAALVAAEQRLGVALPTHLRVLYLLSDGVAWHNCLGIKTLPVLEDIRFGRDFVPPLSSRLRKTWEESGRESGEPEGLQVGGDDWAGMLGEKYELLDFSAVDNMLALCLPDNDDVLMLLLDDRPNLPAHSVLHIEGYCATGYRDLRRWMAAEITTYDFLNNIGK